MKIPNKSRKRIADKLHVICLQRYSAIPLQQMIEVCGAEGIKVEADDLLFLCGREGRANFDTSIDGVETGSWLVLQWFKDIDQATYEVTAYLS